MYLGTECENPLSLKIKHFNFTHWIFNKKTLKKNSVNVQVMSVVVSDTWTHSGCLITLCHAGVYG